MSKQRGHVAIGPGSASLILMIVLVSMSILCTLSVLSAHNDDRLSRRSLQVAQENYTLYDQAEITLSELAELLSGAEDMTEEALAALLPENVTLSDGVLQWEEENQNRGLSCAARMTWTEDGIHLTWVEHSVWAYSGEEDELWD